MDDKVFNLLEKMYADLIGKIDNLNSEMQDKFKELKDGQTKIEMALESSIKPNTKMALEELVAVKEKQIEHDVRFDSLESRIESHDVEISVIKRVK